MSLKPERFPSSCEPGTRCLAWGVDEHPPGRRAQPRAEQLLFAGRKSRIKSLPRWDRGARADRLHTRMSRNTLALYLNSGLILTFYVFFCSDIWLYRSAHFGLQGLLCYLRCNKWSCKSTGGSAGIGARCEKRQLCVNVCVNSAKAEAVVLPEGQKPHEQGPTSSGGEDKYQAGKRDLLRP